GHTRAGNKRADNFLTVEKRKHFVSLPSPDLHNVGILVLNRDVAVGGPGATLCMEGMRMTDMAASSSLTGHGPAARPNLDKPINRLSAIIFIGLLAVGLLYTAHSLYSDVSDAGVRTSSLLPFLLLGVALLVALGFEFVNGFHDTANAVATVIYTH